MMQEIEKRFSKEEIEIIQTRKNVMCIAHDDVSGDTLHIMDCDMQDMAILLAGIMQLDPQFKDILVSAVNLYNAGGAQA